MMLASNIKKNNYYILNKAINKKLALTSFIKP
jgi:hypothetical protein